MNDKSIRPTLPGGAGMTEGLRIIGTTRLRRNHTQYLIAVDGRQAYLSPRMFEYLLVLANNGQNWVYKGDLEPGFNQARYIYRLRAELTKQGIDMRFDNNGLGYYRLPASIHPIVIEWGSLLEYPHATIAQIAREAIGKTIETLKRKGVIDVH